MDMSGCSILIIQERSALLVLCTMRWNAVRSPLSFRAEHVVLPSMPHSIERRIHVSCIENCDVADIVSGPSCPPSHVVQV
eukprot:scaffold346_cov347-Pavlova_lutheri.AAC.21